MFRTANPSLWGFALVLVVLGCGSSGADIEAPGDSSRTLDSPPVAIGDTTTAYVGETVTFEHTDIDMTFLGIAGDSRCPIGVTCVWEGDAEVRLLLETEGGRSEVTLHTTLEPRAAPVGSYALELLDVRPYPTEGESTDPETLRVVVRLVEAGTGA